MMTAVPAVMTMSMMRKPVTERSEMMSAVQPGNSWPERAREIMVVDCRTPRKIVR